MGGLDSFWDNKTNRNADLRYGSIRVIGSLDHEVGGCVFYGWGQGMACTVYMEAGSYPSGSWGAGGVIVQCRAID